jgi:hypothetical protein
VKKNKNKVKIPSDQKGLVFSHNDYTALIWGHARHKDKRKVTDATFYIVDAVSCSAMLIPSQRRSVGR